MLKFYCYILIPRQCKRKTLFQHTVEVGGHAPPCPPLPTSIISIESLSSETSQRRLLAAPNSAVRGNHLISDWDHLETQQLRCTNCRRFQRALLTYLLIEEIYWFWVLGYPCLVLNSLPIDLHLRIKIGKSSSTATMHKLPEISTSLTQLQVAWLIRYH